MLVARIFARGGIGALVIAVAMTKTEIDALLNPRAHHIFRSNEIQRAIAISVMRGTQVIDGLKGRRDRGGHFSERDECE